MSIASEVLPKFIRDIPDFPKPGIIFKDLSPLFADPYAFRTVVWDIEDTFNGQFDIVAGIEARGFPLASAIAQEAGTGFALIRKPGKLPFTTHSQNYNLEYGTSTLELHTDAFNSGQRVLILDDVLATGGTAQAAAHLVEQTGATVAGLAFILELGFLSGSDKLTNYSTHSTLVV